MQLLKSRMMVKRQTNAMRRYHWQIHWPNLVRAIQSSTPEIERVRGEVGQSIQKSLLYIRLVYSTNIFE